MIPQERGVSISGNSGIQYNLIMLFNTYTTAHEHFKVNASLFNDNLLQQPKESDWSSRGIFLFVPEDTGF